MTANRTTGGNINRPRPMDDEQLLRYSRQIMLPQFGVEKQQRLLHSHVLLIGLGGLGAPAAMYLAAAGIGTLTLVDHDQVDLSNLQRQVIHPTEAVGRPKVESAKQTLLRLNPQTRIHTIDHRLDPQSLSTHCRAADLVIDATDNFAIRFALNKACVETSTPLVSGAAIRFEGQVTVFDLRRADGPCYRCLYPDTAEVGQSCSENGILAPVTGIIGSIQALEAIKILTGTGLPLQGRLLLLDALHMEWRELKISRDPGCPVFAPIKEQIEDEEERLKQNTMQNKMQQVTLPRTLVNQILAHAQSRPQQEVCGLLSARHGVPMRLHRIHNAAADPQKLFDMDAPELIRAFREMRERGEQLFAIYHSHPRSAARPSRLDQDLLAYPQALYLIISLNEKGVLQLNGFRCVDEKTGMLQQVELAVTD